MIALGVLLLLLAGIALPLAHLKATRYREELTEREMDKLVAACLSYFHDTNELPHRLKDLAVRPSSGVHGWAGPYIGANPVKPGATPDYLMDAWDQPYEVIPETESYITIYSAGAHQDDLEDDIVRWIDVSPQRREATLERLGVLNAAIDHYLHVHPGSKFLEGVGALLDALREEHFVSTDGSLRQDGWGQAWIADPPDQSPILRLTSRHFLRGSSAGGG
jgi:hypothetical protein